MKEKRESTIGLPMRCTLFRAGLFLLALLAPVDGLAQQAGPSELASLITEGIVDPDVLNALGSGERVQAIVHLTPGAEPVEQQTSRLRTHLPELRLVRRFDHGRGLAIHATEAELVHLARNPAVQRIGLDRRVRVQLSEAVPLVELEVLNNQGYTGAGRLVAIIDTGVDIDHPDLEDAIVDEACFCLGDDGVGGSGCCPNGMDTQTGPGAGDDGHGHGTRVAGVVTSAGIITAAPGAAPDVGLLAIRVISPAGGGWASDVAAGMDWVATNWPDADVVNMSLGGGKYAGDCDLADASTALYAAEIDALWDLGILAVAGAGNNGWGEDMIAPACVARAVSVGAVWDAGVGSRTNFGCTDATTAADQVACWSNSSATTDVFAPGGRMTTTNRGGGSTTSQGTSYATPVVSACAAVLRGAFSATTVTGLSLALITSPTTVVDTTSGRSFPRLDCHTALGEIPLWLPTFRGGDRIWLAVIAFFLFSGVVVRVRGHP